MTATYILDSLHRELLGAHLIQLKGVGHSPNIEAPEAFNRVIAQFLLAD